MASSSSSGLYFQLHQTAEAFINSYDQQKCAEDIASLSSTLTPDCKRYISPTSSGDAIPLSNNDHEDSQSKDFALAESRTMEIKDITVDEVQRKSTIHAVHTFFLKDEYHTSSSQQIWNFGIIFTLWMTEDGRKIFKVAQFVDSQLTARWNEELSWVCPGSKQRDHG